jgi:hypothetical protein
MNPTSIEDVKKIHLKYFAGPDKHLTPLGIREALPFKPLRLFFCDNVESGRSMGKHAHFVMEKALWCLSGSLQITCKDGSQTRYEYLNSPNEILFIPHLIWDEEIYNTRDTTLLILAGGFYVPLGGRKAPILPFQIGSGGRIILAKY